MSGLPLLTMQPYDTSEASWQEGTWWQQLLPGSWRGVPFVMDAAENRAGRRTTVHEYPYRDSVWVEDLGRLPRAFAFQAFLTGDDVYQQRDAMIAACELAGPGTLVHPTMGTVQVVLVEFSAVDRRERGRYVEITFNFILASDVLFPTLSSATGQVVNLLSDALGTAAGSDFSSVWQSIRQVPTEAGAAIADFTGMANGVVNDASRVFGSLAGLPGFLGRYASGALGVVQNNTVTKALGLATTARTAVLGATSGIDNLVSML